LRARISAGILDDTVRASRQHARIYEDRHTRPELRWFWSITVSVDPKHGIITNGRTETLEEAKAKFLASWQRCHIG
jgi:hypothetical protein